MLPIYYRSVDLMRLSWKANEGFPLRLRVRWLKETDAPTPARPRQNVPPTVGPRLLRPNPVRARASSFPQQSLRRMLRFPRLRLWLLLAIIVRATVLQLLASPTPLPPVHRL